MITDLSARHGCISQQMHIKNLNSNLICQAPLKFYLSRQIAFNLNARNESNTRYNHRHQQNRCVTVHATLTSELPPPDADGSGSPKQERNPLFTGGQPTIILAGFYLEELPAIRQLLDAAGGRDITLVPSMPWLLDLPLHRALAEGEPEWEQPMPPTWVQGGGWGRRRVALFNDIGSLAQGTILTVLESSPVGKVSGLATTSEDMETNLGDLLAKAADAGKVAEKQPKMDFVDSMEALPPIETLLGDTVEQLKREKSGVFEENKEIEEEKPSPSVPASSDDGDSGESSPSLLDDEIDLIDKIVAEFNIN